MPCMIRTEKREKERKKRVAAQGKAMTATTEVGIHCTQREFQCSAQCRHAMPPGADVYSRLRSKPGTQVPMASRMEAAALGDPHSTEAKHSLERMGGGGVEAGRHGGRERGRGVKIVYMRDMQQNGRSINRVPPLLTNRMDSFFSAVATAASGCMAAGRLFGSVLTSHHTESVSKFETECSLSFRTHCTHLNTRPKLGI